MSQEAASRSLKGQKLKAARHDIEVFSMDDPAVSMVPSFTASRSPERLSGICSPTTKW